MQRNTFVLAGFGFLSGVINATLAAFNVYPVFFLAGAVYGLVTGLYFIQAVPLVRKYMRLCVWIIVSEISYLAAFFTIYVSSPVANQLIFGKDSGPIQYALGGLVGALILSLVFHFLFRKISIAQHIWVVAVGAAVVSLAALIATNDMLMPIFYIGWQTLVTVALGFNSASASNQDSLQPMTVPTKGLPSR